MIKDLQFRYRLKKAQTFSPGNPGGPAGYNKCINVVNHSD